MQFEVLPWMALAIIFWRPIASTFNALVAKYRGDEVAESQQWEACRVWLRSLFNLIAKDPA